jgi:hypothetical protein
MPESLPDNAPNQQRLLPLALNQPSLFCRLHLDCYAAQSADLNLDDMRRRIDRFHNLLE